MDLTNVILAILGIGFLVAFHELGHHLTALWCGMRVRRYSIGFGRAILSKEYKGVQYTVGALPLGGFVDIVGMNPLEEGAEQDPKSYHRRPRWARALVVAAGPAFNYILAFFIFLGLFWVGGLKQDLEFVVKKVTADSAAEAVGIQPGDVVITVGGEKLSKSSELPAKVGAAAGQPLDLQIRRGNETLVLSPIPRGERGAARLGIEFDTRGVGPSQNYPFGESVMLAGAQTVHGTVAILDSLARMFRPGEKLEVGGPVAIVSQLNQSANKSLADFIWMLAALSLMLGIVNLLPIPPLDGSKLVFLGAETVARREISARLQMYVQGVGLLIMLSILLVVTVGDVGRLFSDEKSGQKSSDPPPATAPANP